MKSFRELADLSGWVVLITRGAGHLGQTFGHTLAELGASVALVDRHGQGAQDAAKKISEQYGVKTLGISVELSNEKATCALPQQVVDEFGGLDILINNAGFVGTDKMPGWCVPFEEQTADTWRKVTEVNMTAPFFLAQAAYPFLKAKKNGTVINMGSIYGFVGPDLRLYEDLNIGTNAAAYAASKGGLIQVTRWLATALAPDVRFNSVSPGGIWRNQHPTFVERYESRTPMKRMGTEEDLIGVIAWLASDLSKYVTGQHIAIDGGWSVW